MKKVRSFTVLELLIVMTITSIVIGIAYTGASLFFKEFLVFQERATKSSGVSLLDRLLVNDIENSNEMSYDNNALFCKGKHRLIEYQFTSEYVVRVDSAIADTFRFSFKEPVVKFNGREKDEGLIDYVEISMVHNELPLILQYQKLYGADILMQLTSENNGRN